MGVATEATRLRSAAEARPLKLPVNRRVGEEHHSITPDGLSVWHTIQLSSSRRIFEVVFEREGRVPADAECQEWLAELLPGRQASEAPSFPGSFTRRFEVFERLTKS